MDHITYNIPADQIGKYRGRQVVVRSADPANVVRQLSKPDLENVCYIQLLVPDVTLESIEELSSWDQDTPIDIVLGDPSSEYPLLYNFSRLLDKLPVRASIAVKPGFGNAVKLATALNFAVNLDVGQPDEGLIDELKEVLELYLHGRQVTTPVDYFHSIFLSFYRAEQANLWRILEEDPDYFRFVADDGVESISRRFDGADLNALTPSNGSVECKTCRFFGSCGGYFKWPDKTYNCNGIRSIFGTIETAANELKETVAAFTDEVGGIQS